MQTNNEGIDPLGTLARSPEHWHCLWLSDNAATVQERIRDRVGTDKEYQGVTAFVITGIGIVRELGCAFLFMRRDAWSPVVVARLLSDLSDKTLAPEDLFGADGLGDASLAVVVDTRQPGKSGLVSGPGHEALWSWASGGAVEEIG